MPARWRAPPRLALGLVLAAGAARRAAATAGRLVLAFAGDDRRQVAVMPFDLLADQLLDGVDIFGVVARGDGEGLAGAAGAAGAADAVDIVLGMDRHVVVEDVADVGNVEAACRDVGGDEIFQLAVAKAGEHRHACALVHVAMQRAGVELVLDQRLVELRHLDLAVAEDDRVLQAVGLGVHQVAQHLALVPRLGAGLDQLLGDRCWRWTRRAKPRRAPARAGTSRSAW